jgi:1,4-alpha-glucan branching enzyme
MVAVTARHPDASGPARLALDQAARELLLLQSSDWPFLISTGQAREYAVERFRTHLERFESLVGSVEAGSPSSEVVESLWERDKVFPEIDYRWFRA